VKKLLAIIFLALQLSCVPVLGSTYNVIKQKELVEIYNIAFQSFMPRTDDLENIKYIAVNMKSDIFKDFNEKEKQQILDSFKKYNKEVINESVETIKEKGIADKYGNLKEPCGVSLNIVEVQIVSDHKVIIEGYYYFSPLSGIGRQSTIEKIDGKWKLTHLKFLYIA